jgi:hypothetical protein
VRPAAARLRVSEMDRRNFFISFNSARYRLERLGKAIGRLAKRTKAFPFGSIKQWMNQGAFLMRG